MDHRPDILRAGMRRSIELLGPLGLRCGLPGSTDRWPWFNGAAMLVAWKGARMPLPLVDRPEAGSRLVIAGLARPGASQVETYLMDWDNGVWHFATLRVGGGGMINDYDLSEIVTRVRTGGAWLGAMAATPAMLAAQRLPGNVPEVSWMYSAVGEQARPAEFRVYASSGSAFNFASPVGTVAFVTDQTEYSWEGDALSEGDVRYYTVRAVTAAGVQSLIPRVSSPPSESYTSVELARSARVEIPAPPVSDPGTLWLEVA